VNLEAVRTELPVLEHAAYLNTGTFGPLPRRTAEVMAGQISSELATGRSGLPYWEHVRALRVEAREAVARLLGTASDCVALTRSTSEACILAVASLKLKPEDEIVTTDVEHFGLLGALRASGAQIRIARIREHPAEKALEAIEAASGPRTRLIALSHVSWTTGHVLPIAQLSSGEIPVLVDGAQSAGAIPVSVRELGCAFYTVSGQKWLLGPDGTGALYVDPDILDSLRVPFPSYFGTSTREETGDFTPVPGAPRLEPGTVPAPALAGLLASLEFAAEAGEARFARAREATERCRSLLEDRAEVVTEANQATLVSFRPRGDAAETVARLLERGVIVRDLPGLGWVRVSVGFWTSDEEIDRLVQAL
jgi:L-cysteine/cystine lyase